MDFICVGSIVNTHGIKGEVRILSNFKYKDKVFVKGSNLYVGNEKLMFVISSYRRHKKFDQVIFDGINDINDVLCYKGMNVYINRFDFCFDGYLNEDLINMCVYSDSKLIGHVSDILNNGVYDILVIDNKYFIPYVDEFIVSVKDNVIKINEIEGLIYED